MMAAAGTLKFSHKWEIYKKHRHNKQFQSIIRSDKLHVLPNGLSSLALHQDPWSIHLSGQLQRPLGTAPRRCNLLKCHCLLNPSQSFGTTTVKNGAIALSRALQDRPIISKLAPAVGIILFAVWGLGPLMRLSRNIFTHRSDGTSGWGKSSTHYVTTSYIQPLLLWTGAILVCRALDPIVLPSEASHIVKQRLITFVRSLSTVLAFAYCLSSAIQQTQKFFMETKDTSDTRNMGFQFAGKAVYTAVWVAAVSLFMELLGFSTQKWLTAGSLGTVLLTLAGREIFTNFLSSAMIHATRPFVVNEWIKVKIDGYEVSGTVEHVGWWSPTIVRGEDREANHIPNHKFTMNIVRNLTQKTHWRIKTHLAISHLDVNKINIIVADMRKVLAKNPQVEQQRLHRRVFLENVDPENQALMILVSCFVKTSHYEEYLCVKEAILLDLLRIISHHRARLATPIRTVQKIYNDSDSDGFPLTDSVFTRGQAVSNRPLLLIEPQYKVNGEDKPKSQSSKSTGKANSKAEVKVGVNPSDSKTKDTTQPDVRNTDKGSRDEKLNADKTRTETKEGVPSISDGSKNKNTKSVSKGPQLAESPTSDNKIMASDELLQSSSKDNKQSQAGSSKSKSGGMASSSESKRESEPQLSRSVMEDNLVLGVALDGSKRTLPIEEGMNTTSTASVEVKELTTSLGGKGSSSAESEKKDGKNVNIPSPTGTD